MTLILTLRNPSALTSGGEPRFVLERRGGTIGRSDLADWTLADPTNTVSREHCEIRFDGEGYTLRDTSTCGTYVNGAALNGGIHRLADGDVIVIPTFEIVAALPHAPRVAEPPRKPGGWGDVRPVNPPAPPPATARPGGGWPGVRTDPSMPAVGPSGHSTPVPQGTPDGQSVWRRLEEANAVRWHGSSPAPATPPPFTPPPFTAAPSTPPPITPAPASRPPMPPESFPPFAPQAPDQQAAAPQGPVPGAMPAPDLNPVIEQALGLAPGTLTQDGAASLAALCNVARLAISGLFVMLEARTKAKAQLGAQRTVLEAGGTNPLKFSVTVEQALAQLLNPPVPGYVSTERAIDNAFLDLQSHQMATLRAMQGALAAVIERYSPPSIAAQAGEPGVLGQMMPNAREARLWRAYVKAFSGVNERSSEVFLENFAKEFRKAYEASAARGGN